MGVDTAKPKRRMQDIAAQAKVSIGTVSRVLSGKTDVAPDLAERVLAVARSLGYERKVSKQFRQAREVGAIGFLVDTVESAPDLYQQNFIAALQQSVNSLGGHLMFALCHDEATRGVIPSMISEGLVRGIIIKASQTTPDAWLERIDQLVPLVLLMHNCVNRSISSVSSDHYTSVYQPLEYLRSLGHTRIGFLGVLDVGLPESTHHIERREAFLKYSALMGCHSHPAYLQSPTRDPFRDSLVDTVDKALEAYWNLGKDRPTAILCATDNYATALIAAAARRGIRLPHDLSITGIMNHESSEHSDPPLTSVSLCQDDIGRAAVQLLQERIENPEMPGRHVQVCTRLIVRGSCTAPSH